jgi:hypothetical protein
MPNAAPHFVMAANAALQTEISARILPNAAHKAPHAMNGLMDLEACAASAASAPNVKCLRTAAKQQNQASPSHARK